MGTEKALLVEDARQDATKLVFVDEREDPAAAFSRNHRISDGGEQVAVALEVLTDPAGETRDTAR